jgi:acyl-CoA synthetase
MVHPITPPGHFATRIDPVWARWWRSIAAWTDELLGAQFSRFCVTHADATVLVDGQVRLTFGEFDEVVHRLACGLRERGVGPGDTVGFQLPSLRRSGPTFGPTSFGTFLKSHLQRFCLYLSAFAAWNGRKSSTTLR